VDQNEDLTGVAVEAPILLSHRKRGANFENLLQRKLITSHRATIRWDLSINPRGNHGLGSSKTKRFAG
jgi:hypothetical protein